MRLDKRKMEIRQKMMSFKSIKRIRAQVIHRIKRIKFKKKENQTACKKYKNSIIAHYKNNNQNNCRGCNSISNN